MGRDARRGRRHGRDPPADQRGVRGEHQAIQEGRLQDRSHRAVPPGWNDGLYEQADLTELCSRRLLPLAGEGGAEGDGRELRLSRWSGPPPPPASLVPLPRTLAT